MHRSRRQRFILQNYRLVITGHSLGAGAAAILAIHLRRDYPKLICYAYSPPGGLLRLIRNEN